jgi:hypothetical protein
MIKSRSKNELNEIGSCGILLAEEEKKTGTLKNSGHVYMRMLRDFLGRRSPLSLYCEQY